MTRPRDLIFGGVLALLTLQAIVLILFGQPWICECGYVKVWEGVVSGAVIRNT